MRLGTAQRVSWVPLRGYATVVLVLTPLAGLWSYAANPHGDWVAAIVGVPLAGAFVGAVLVGLAGRTSRSR